MKKISSQIPSSIHNKAITFDMFYQEEQREQSIVLFVHGFKGYKDWGAFPMMCEYLAKAGFIVVNMNFSHNGTTPTELIDFPDLEAFGQNTFSKELGDMKDLISYLKEDTTIKKHGSFNKLFVMGHSRGGATSLIQSYEDNRIYGTITLGSVITIKDKYADKDWETWNKEGVKYVYNGRTKQNMPLYKTLAEDIFENEIRFDILNFAPSIQKPTLIIHGTDDQVISLEESLLIKKVNQKIEHIIIEDANHTFGAIHPYQNHELPFHLQSAMDKCISFIKQHE
ncbi:MAG: prolyl oligopeptidase family serine peptidase [Cytophagales bacterium]|nr:prolyl oligopeptidase family serine peptidase [Cytophagales bacterium]